MFKVFSKIIFAFCAIITFIFILVQMVEACYSVYLALTEPNNTRLIFSREEIHNLVVILFSIFIGLEILETIKIYFTEGEIKASLIIEIGLVAVMRKLLTLDITNSTPMLDIGLGVLIVSIGITFFLIRKTNQSSIFKKMQNTKARYEK